MRFFDLFRKAKAEKQSIWARAVAEFDDNAVTYTRASGTVEQVRWADLSAVLIGTAAGPAVDDFFWILIGQDGKIGCSIHSESVGCDRLRDRLQQLSNFNFDAAIQACACTEVRTFLCWERRRAEQ